MSSFAYFYFYFLSKSIIFFLYDRNLRHEKVEELKLFTIGFVLRVSYMKFFLQFGVHVIFLYKKFFFKKMSLKNPKTLRKWAIFPRALRKLQN